LDGVHRVIRCSLKATQLPEYRFLILEGACAPPTVRSEVHTVLRSKALTKLFRP